MDSSDFAMLFGRILFFLLIYAVSTARRESEEESPPRRRGTMADSPTFADGERLEKLDAATCRRRAAAHTLPAQ